MNISHAGRFLYSIVPYVRGIVDLMSMLCLFVLCLILLDLN